MKFVTEKRSCLVTDLGAFPVITPPLCSRRREAYVRRQASLSVKRFFPFLLERLRLDVSAGYCMCTSW